MQLTNIHIRCVCRSKKNEVFVNGKKLPLQPTLKIRSHSPDGFNWGYSGSGPAQTALAICLEIFGDKAIAQRVYQDFKFAYVASWPNGKDHETFLQLEQFAREHNIPMY